MKRVMSLCFLVVLMLSVAGYSREWTGTAVGNDDLLSVRIGTRPFGERTEMGVFGIWHDGLTEAEQEAFGVGVYATYDVVNDATFKVLNVQVPVTWYAGGQLGAAERKGVAADATAALMTGVSFGGAKVRIGLEFQYFLDETLWREFGAIDENARLMLAMAYRF
jgi:hypothetical protein